MYIGNSKSAIRFVSRKPRPAGGLFHQAMKACRACAALLVVFGPAMVHGEDDEVARLIDDIQRGPSVYYTPEALDYFRVKAPGKVAGIGAQDKDAALRAFRAAIKLSTMGSKAVEAAGVLVEKFPTACHVSVIRGVEFTPGHGTFEDWVHTYAVSERKKFLLGSSLLEYATLVKCKELITTETDREILSRQVSSGGRITRASTNIFIVIKLYAGACALTRLSGQALGTEQEAWRRWYYQTGGSFTAAPPPPDPGAGSGSGVRGTSMDDLVEKATYRMVLNTGDEFTGTVEAIDDTSLIFETVDGEAYTFNKDLVREYELLSPPPEPKEGGGPAEAEVLTYRELTLRSPQGVMLEVSLTNGSTLRGRLISITRESMKLDIEGAEIPVTEEAVREIRTVPPGKPKEAPEKASEDRPRGPLDTLIVRNPETDDYGRPLEDLVLPGRILADSAGGVKFKKEDGTIQHIPYDTIKRRITHTSQDPELAAIQRYGKSLFCPEGMILVDIPPGKEGRPFFKVCIDACEYPNRKGETPRTNVSFDDARGLCKDRGKRLCTVDEWKWACSGLEEFPYPYGHRFDEDYCNTEGNKFVETSGERRKCISKFGVYDMTGNVFEWVVKNNGEPAAMGGPLSKCHTVSPGGSGSAKPTIGFRCCKGN